MNTALKRRLDRLETIAGRSGRNTASCPVIEPAPHAGEEQWRQFEIRKAEAEATAKCIIVIRADHPVRPIAYRCRVVIVPPKIPASVQVRMLQGEGADHAH